MSIYQAKVWLHFFESETSAVSPSGFLGFTPLTKGGSEMLWRLCPSNFSTPNLSKTSQQQAPAYHSKQCYLVAFGKLPFSQN